MYVLYIDKIQIQMAHLIKDKNNYYKKTFSVYSTALCFLMFGNNRNCQSNIFLKQKKYKIISKHTIFQNNKKKRLGSIYLSTEQI